MVFPVGIHEVRELKGYLPLLSAKTPKSRKEVKQHMPRKYQLQEEANNARFCVSATNVNTIYQESFKLTAFGLVRILLAWVLMSGQDEQVNNSTMRGPGWWETHPLLLQLQQRENELGPIVSRQFLGFLRQKARQGYNNYITLCQVLKSLSYNLSKICEGPSALGQQGQRNRVNEEDAAKKLAM